jgi:hypothetical protein
MKVRHSDAINQVSRELGHVSRRTKLPATEQNAGNMTAEQAQQLAQDHKQLKDLPDNTDILKTSPGYYSVYNPINSPLKNPSRFFVDVKKNANGDKVIQATALYTGRTWKMVTRTTNNNPDTPNVWVESVSERVLWSGSVTSVGTTMNLVDDLSEYDGMRVIFTIGSTQQSFSVQSVNTDGEFYVPDYMVLYGNNMNVDTVKNYLYPTRIELTKTAAKQLKISYYKLYTMDVDKMITVMTHDNGDFSINAIIGLK